MTHRIYVTPALQRLNAITHAVGNSIYFHLKYFDGSCPFLIDWLKLLAQPFLECNQSLALKQGLWLSFQELKLIKFANFFS